MQRLRRGGITTKATFDAYGRAVSATDANGETSTTAFSPATGRPSSTTVTNPLGHTTVTTLDPDRQQPTAVVDANSKTSTNIYDALGRLSSVKTPEQASGDPAAYTFSYRVERGQASRVTTKQLQSGSTYISSWAFLDGLGRERQTQTVSPASTEGSPKSIVTNTRYDELGNTAAEAMPVVVNGTAGSALLSIPSGEVDETRHTYDSLNRVTLSEQYGQGTKLWETQVAHYGDHVRTTPPNGGAVQTVWTDRRGREVKKQQGTGSSLVSTDYAYTTTDQLASMTDPGGHTSTYTYDLLDRQIAADDMDAGESKTTFDDNGNPTAVFDAKALAVGGTTPSISTEYDELSRPTGRWEGNTGTGKKVATWTYDTLTNGKGRLTKQTTHEGAQPGDLDYSQEVIGYDPRGRVTGSKWTVPGGLLDLGESRSFTVGYGYDTADHRTSIEYQDSGLVGLPAETITTSYNSLGYPTTLAGSQTYLSATDYAADGKLAGRTYANPNNPLTRAYGYSQATQRLAQVQTTLDGAVEQDDRYTWDDSGNLTRILDQQLSTPVATCYTYDTLARLRHAWTTDTTDCSDSSSTTTADGPAGYNKAWNYSGDGNITSIRNRSTTRTFSYGDTAHPHAATQAGPDDFEYDANGSMVERSKDLLGDLIPSELTYDNQHQLKSVSRLIAPLDETKFVYLPDGTRIARYDPLGLTGTIYIDGQEITITVAGGDAVLSLGARYYQHESTTVAIRQASGLTWQLNDHQASAQVAVPSGSSIATRTYYDPYGNERAGSLPPPTDRGWLGQTHDPTTDLTHLGARYYDPEISRFITTDPLAVNQDAQTANAYNYAASNPIKFTDPTGLTPCVQDGDCNGYEYTYGKGLSKTRQVSGADWRQAEGWNGSRAGRSEELDYGSLYSKETAEEYEYDSILMYMYSEMVLNSSSPPAAHIKDCQELLPLICVPNEYEVWFAMVAPNGKWDHKQRILDTFDMGERGTTFTPVPGSGDKAISHDFWSNMHYGYVGREVGFAAWELHAGADAADLVMHQQTFPADGLAIQIGIDLRAKYQPSELEPAHIRQAIAENLPALTRTGAAKTCPAWPSGC